MEQFPSRISTVSSSNLNHMQETVSVPVPTGKWETSNPCQRPESKDQLYSDDVLKTFDSVLRLVEQQCAVEPSGVRPRKSEKEFLGKVEVLKRKLAKESRIGNDTFIDFEYSDSDSKSETTWRNDWHSERKRKLIRQALNGKLRQGKVKQPEIKILSLLNKNRKDPANQYLVKQNKVAVLGGLLQQVVQDGRITAADLGIKIEMQVLVLESLLEEAVHELKYITFRGYHNKDSKRTVAILRDLLKQTEHVARKHPKRTYRQKVGRDRNPSLESGTGSLSTLKGEACSGHKAAVYIRRNLVKQAIREHNDEYKKFPSSDNKPRRRVQSSQSDIDFAINKNDYITVLTGLLQLAILEFNLHDGSEVTPCPNRLNNKTAAFPCRDRYRNVPNYSEMGNILKCKSEYNRPGNERDFYEEFYKDFKSGPVPSVRPFGYIGQDKCGTVTDTYKCKPCPSAASVNLGFTNVMDPRKCENLLSSNDDDEDSKFNVEIKELCPKNLENEYLQTVPVKLYSKKHHLADNCTQTSIEDMSCSKNHKCSRSDEKKYSSVPHSSGLVPGNSEMYMCHRHKKEVEDSLSIAKK